MDGSYHQELAVQAGAIAEELTVVVMSMHEENAVDEHELDELDVPDELGEFVVGSFDGFAAGLVVHGDAVQWIVGMVKVAEGRGGTGG
ncbi:uncharacterized protein A1O5_11186 [Cladophialophora psammophila CBS 110553]|uniref:Uncharacterized protein n=1 Tax=Cladophialophora psammophila CBS 110553 TaxID=1182543 RepID=W9X5C4_9EURO|nr:uncharacterized protein A1O5_11186 [Cladophialophora psammophila CBS 110553]EXJ65659.1 hypothetical protein A1O5_11186 [Cladophialophora psammophila CBS 110553]